MIGHFDLRTTLRRKKGFHGDLASACMHKICADAFWNKRRDSVFKQQTGGGRVGAGRPDMEVLPTDENNVRRAIRIEIGDALRSYYGDLLKEGIPNRLTDLLRCLDETEKGAFESED
jgi:hypothetical protein